MHSIYVYTDIYTYVTLHGKTRNKVIARAQHANTLWHYTLSVFNTVDMRIKTKDTQ